jgi:hypothetical protein
MTITASRRRKLDISFTALLLFHNDAHNHKITGILKQLKIKKLFS